ncbi:SR-related and CTD-associated factor 4 isoform X2 [Drosophila willistoni]|uniref:SR-related and CTD-associated factor 4 isoform X2 n=1 Tax=Drosophila willistoni TaxID=7260 RepID=UPI000C26C522|nr:SR-related and CTD-associated factor 4 isoform X2 [Drosophila willistoni]
METVVAFNNELSGLYDSRPPISKAKMAAITKSAMRAIKFYKHVVQSVEKFILKCKPEYKVPGLYVIDSIVRQSRHQYGTDKDVFAPRFQRNLTETFANLFRCAPEDKSRIIRVLNLWQKNNVFKSDVIQPIFDLADPNHPIYHQMPPVGVGGGGGGGGGNVGPGPSSSGALSLADISSGANGLNNSMDLNLSSLTDDKMGGAMPDLSNNNLKQLLNDPNVLRQLQTLQNFQKFKQQEENQKLRYQDEALQQHLQNVLKGNPGLGMGINLNLNDVSDLNKDVEFISEQQPIEVINLDGADSRSPTPDRDRYSKRSRRSSRSRSRSPRGRGSGGGAGGGNNSGRRRGGSSRSRSRSRSPRSSRRRGGSRDRDRMERSNRDKERDREHERERRKKGLPDIKKEHLSVCSTTLWVGHLSKLVYQEELSDTFGEYGDIVSIDQIVPRGCAFIVMNRRQDAHKAMQSLKNHKLQGRAITISWAAGKGVKSKEWKDFWDLELGVTYIPWNKLSQETDFDSLEEGGMFDEDTMPSWMKQKINQGKNTVKDNKSVDLTAVAGGVPPVPVAPPAMLFGIDTTQPPPVGGPPPPGIMGMGMRGQFPPLGPPMGINMPPPMMIPPTNMPPPMMMPTTNMPPPMMLPPTMMQPGFPGIGGPPHPMGLPPGAPFPPPGAVPPPMAAAAAPSSAASNVSDDQMDVEMELEDAAPPPPPQPQPPSFNPQPQNQVEAAVAAVANEMMFQRERERERDRSRGPGSRWGGRDDVAEAAERWRAENGGGPNAAFNEARARLNLNPMDHGGMPRPDFMGDFDNRGGPTRGMGPGPGPRSGNHNGGPGGPGGDFFSPNNMPQNRFNQPTSLMQMRIPPPAAFNQRMGGPPGVGGPGPGPGNPGNGGPMFMRNNNQGGGGGGGPGRQQGFFNPRNPFNNDNQRGRGGPGGNNNNRFRDQGEDRRQGNSRGVGGNGGNRMSRDERSAGGGNRRNSRDENSRHSISSTDDNLSNNNNNNNKQNNVEPAVTDAKSSLSKDNSKQSERQDNLIAAATETKTTPTTATTTAVDTEEDWDRELQEYDARMEAEAAAAAKAESIKPVAEEAFVRPVVEEDAVKPANASPACTPLYDELPPPAPTPQAPPSVTPVVEQQEHIAPEPAQEAASPPPPPRVPTPTPPPVADAAALLEAKEENVTATAPPSPTPAPSNTKETVNEAETVAADESET